MSGHIFTQAPRHMVSYTIGVRPSKNRKDKTFLKEGALFFNLPENIVCVGTQGGGWIEYSLARMKVVPPDA